MASDELLVGLDIGTSKVCVVVGETNSAGELQILGVGRAVSTGLRKGVVVNIEATLRSVGEAVEMAEQAAGREITEVYTCIAGAHIEGINSRGVVAVASKGREITQVDVNRVTEAAKAIVLPMDREIIHTVPQEYIVDGQGGIRNPVDMIGVRLEAEVHIMTGSVTAAQNMIKCINRAGFKVNGYALGALAAAEAVLGPDEKELGTLLIDIGAGTSDLILYREGAPYYTNVLPLGGSQVTSDLSILLKTPFESAERLKKEAGVCWPALIEEYDEPALILGLASRSSQQVDRLELCEYIKPRMEEILGMIKRKVEREAHVRSWSALGGGVVLCGGGALLGGTVELAQEIFGTTARLGVPTGLAGLAPDCQGPDLAAAAGLLRHAVANRGPGGVSRDDKEKKTVTSGEGWRKIWRTFFG